MIIVYIGNVGYPDTASSIHVRNRGIFMKSCGHEVHVLCELASDGKRMEEVDELTYQYMDPYPGRGKIRGAYWNLDQVFGKIYFEQTKKYIDKIKRHTPKTMCAIKNKFYSIPKQRNQIISTEQQPQPQSLLLSFQYLHQFQNERIL